MRILTANIQTTYLKKIDSLIGKDGLYPSRSELVRVAVRNYLLKECEIAKSFMKYYKQKQEQEKLIAMNEAQIPKIDEKLFVQVPIGTKDGKTEFKTYKLKR